MKHIIIGTAGHVDHGKTCLTKALTGVNTDRLKEEQKRGITIDIGFAQLTLPNGQSASIVDVPGHERLIHNMLAGATGMDVVLMVVAADEGFMPQTREHLDILSLLGIKNGIIVITKCDMVDDEWLETVIEDTEEQVKGSFLEGAPVVPVSARTGMGIEALKAKIVELLENSPARPDDRPFRLPVDRVFNVKGFGTVVTGTLVDGMIKTGDTVTVYPSEKAARVRELQNHEVTQESVDAGMRVAINLSGIEKKDLQRGCIVACPGSMIRSDLITVELELTEDSPYTLKNYSPLHFFQGTQEKVCKLRLLDRSELRPGERAYAQLSFNNDFIVARNLDRFIVRFFSPMITIGGGVILDMTERRLRREDETVTKRLDMLNSSPADRVQQMISDAGTALKREDELLSLSGLSAKEVHSAIQQLQQEGLTVKIQGAYITKANLDALWKKLEETLKQHHAEQSLMEGMSLGELREKLFSGSARNADALLGYFQKKNRLRINGSSVALVDFQTSYTPEQRGMQKELEEYYLSCGREPASNKETAAGFGVRSQLCRQVTAKMIKEGTLVAVTPNDTVHSSFCREALELFVKMFENSETVALGEFRTAFGVSRKYAQMYLDYFDSQRISKLVGDRRVLLKNPLKKD